MRKYVVGILLLLLTTLLIACGSDEKEDAEEVAGTMGEISEEEKLDDNEIVAVVNGKDVTGIIYNVVYSQLKLHAIQTDQEVNEEEIQDLTMESIVDRELLFQQAKEEGIEITSEDANSEFIKIKSESKAELATLLDQYQITEEGFKEQLRFELTMNEFMTQVIDVSVTDEDAKEKYEEVKDEGEEEAPPFEEVKDQIKQRLLAEKQQEELQAKIDEVREKATIEKKI